MTATGTATVCFGPTNYAVRDAIARRLVDRHGLSHLAAHTAVARAAAGVPGRHHDLVLAEQDALIEESLAQLKAFTEAIAPAVQQLTATVVRLMDALEPLTAPRRTRPAWQSPYGPQQKGHRR
ncbi:hypothetical protein [Streptomyces sp. C10-9-1]|uniref:hypothetical protein n=1 Tax=Streptomyces sp. C10-9-1 TaxID=1859285 RepID=UPI003F4A045B